MQHLYSILADNIFGDLQDRLTFIQEFDTLTGEGGGRLIHSRLAVASQYKLDEEDRGRTFTHITRLLSPDGEEIASVRSQGSSQNRKHTFVAYFFNTPFAVSGPYTIECFIEESEEAPAQLNLEVNLG